MEGVTMIKFVAHFGHVSITSTVKVNIIVSLKYLAAAVGLVRYLGIPVDIVIANKGDKYRLRGYVYKLSIDAEGQSKITFDVNASSMTIGQLNELQLKNVAVMVKEVQDGITKADANQANNRRNRTGTAQA